MKAAPWGFLVGYSILTVGVVGQLPLLPDTACLRYRFEPGDTVEYRVEARDSILIGHESPLIRERYETLLLVCDSVDRGGNFWLRLLPTAFLARERLDTLQSLRSESPCLQRVTVLQLDSLGRRLAGMSLSPDTVVCLGSPFQLPFLPPLNASCVRLHESWLVHDTLVLWEQATPPPYFVRTALMRRFPTRDTLGFRCREIQFVTTGQGWFARDSAFTVRAVVNSFGRLLLSEDGTPVWSFLTQEIRLHLALGARSLEGLHYTSMTVRLQLSEVPRRHRKSP